MKKELAESTLRSQETNLFVPLLFCFQILCTLTPIGLLRMNSGRTGGKAIVFIISILFLVVYAITLCLLVLMLESKPVEDHKWG